MRPIFGAGLVLLTTLTAHAALGQDSGNSAPMPAEPQTTAPADGALPPAVTPDAGPSAAPTDEAMTTPPQDATGKDAEKTNRKSKAEPPAPPPQR